MVFKKGLRYLGESAATATMIMMCMVWVMTATVGYLLELRSRHKQHDNPYWAEEGDSENIPALRG